MSKAGRRNLTVSSINNSGVTISFMSDKNIVIGVVVLLLGIGAVLYLAGGGRAPAGNLPTVTASSSPIAAFAQCLKDKGAVFYGAFWCPHCKTQKALFGDAVSLLPYVECSTSDGNAQTLECIQKKIEGYPTWEFLDGSRLTGERSFVELGAKTSCPVPPGK